MKPTLLILPRHREPWGAFARELWRYRELLFIFTWRDLKLRYKQTALGMVWVILQPLLSVVVFSVLFGRFAHVPSDGVPYETFAMAGFLAWGYFSGSVMRGSQSLVSHRELVQKIYFPRVLLPAGAVAGGIVDYGIGLVLLGAMIAFHHIVPSPFVIIAFPLLTLAIGLLALAANLWLSALTVRYRDVMHVMPFFIQLWMFLTPVFYPLSMLPAHYRWLAALNPLSGLIEAQRAAFFNLPLDVAALQISLVTTMVLLVSGIFYFTKVERGFADVI